MSEGTRQSTREGQDAINKLDGRLRNLERKNIPSQMKLRASSAYSQSEINAIIDKINELLRELGK